MKLPIRWAVVGCGMLARGAHLPNIVRSGRMRLQVCCDVSEAHLELCGREFSPVRLERDFGAAVRDPEVDAICLATTDKLRLPAIAAAAAAGKPIYVEKPLASTLEEIYQIRDVVRAAGIPFCVGHNRRCSPAMIEARRIFRGHMEHPRRCPWRLDREGPARPQLADDGVAGMLVCINDDWYSWKKWALEAGQSPLIFEMTHFTDLCNWFLAAEPVEVMAAETGMLHHSVSIRYAGGELATIFMCANGTFGYPKELYEMMGNGGLVAVDHMVEVRTAGIAGAAARTVFPMIGDRHAELEPKDGIAGWLARKRAACQEVVTSGDAMQLFAAEPNKGHAHALERFVDQMLGQGGEVCGVEAAVLATRVAFAAVRSAKERRWVGMGEV